VYPSLNPNSWEPLYTAAAKYPQLAFNAVGAYLSNPRHLIIKLTQLSVNIVNGPGPNPLSDTNYITSISTLHTYPNINTLGYVHIRIYPSNSTILRPTADVVAEIAQYSTWNLPSSNTQVQDIHLNGIFIDEAPSDAGNYTYMSTLTSAAREHSFSLVIFNPGIVDTVRMYFNLADYIVMFENSYGYYSTGGGNASLDTIEPMYRRKSIIDIYDFDDDAAVQNGIVNELVEIGFGGLYIDDLPNRSLAQTGAYDHFEPLFWGFGGQCGYC
jgi:hypothetical protein